MDNDFGDDFGEDEDEEEEDEEEELPAKVVVAEVKKAQVTHDIFEDSRSKEDKKPVAELAPKAEEAGSKQGSVEEESEEDQEKLIID